MSDLRTFAQLQLDALRLVDLENAANRFPPATVGDFVNRGIDKTYSEMLACWDQPFYLAEAGLPIPIPAWGQPAIVALPMDYLQMVGLSVSSGPTGRRYPIDRYRDERERMMLLSSGSCGVPGQFKWGFAASPQAFTQGVSPNTAVYSIEILPNPSFGAQAWVRYVPSFRPLVNPQDTFDGIAGWWDAATTWAAILMRRQDDLDTAALQGDWAAHIARMTMVARRRDRSAPPQVSIVMGWGSGRGRRGGGRW